MPSQTIYIPEREYDFIRETADESFSGRAAELIEKGREFEQEVEL